jgi:hypothetical protein
MTRWIRVECRSEGGKKEEGKVLRGKMKRTGERVQPLPKATQKKKRYY